MEAYLVNPITRRKAAGSRKRRSKRQEKHMAKKRKSSRKRRQPAALRKYWAAKRGKKSSRKRSRPSAKSSRRRGSRRRHIVRAHRVGGYRRPRTGASYMSNPFGGVLRGATDGLMAAGVLFGALFLVGWANGQKGRIPALASGWGALAAKLAIGLGMAMLAREANRRGWLSSDKAIVASAAGFAPLGLDILGRIAPQLAGQVTLADEVEPGYLAAPLPSGMDPALNAELAAELEASDEQESEASAF